MIGILGFRFLIFTFCFVLFGVLLLEVLPVLPFGGYAEQRWLLLMLSGGLVVAGLIWLWVLNNRQVIMPLSSLYLIVAFAVSFPFLTFLTPAHHDWRWVEPGMYAFYFLAVGFTGLYLAASGKAFAFAAYLAVAAAAACFLYGAMTVNVYLFILASDETKLTSYIPWGFVNIRYWSHIATWLLPVLPLAALAGPLSQHRLWRGLVATGAGLWWWILLLSTGRGSMLGIMVGILFAIALFGRLALPWLKKMVFYLLLGVGFWLLLSVLIPGLLFDEAELRTLKTDSAGRIPLFIEAWRMSLQNFPFGMGPQSWLTHEPLTEAYQSGKKFGHPHNMYLMWAAEYGWLMVLLLAAVVLGLLSKLLKLVGRLRLAMTEDNGNSKDIESRALLSAGVTASVFAAALHAGLSAVFMAPGSMLIGLFILAAFWALVHSEPFPVKRNALKHEGATWVTRLIGIVLIFAAGVLWALWAQQVWLYQQAMMLDEPFYYSQENEGMLPRFWLHGNFPR